MFKKGKLVFKLFDDDMFGLNLELYEHNPKNHDQLRQLAHELLKIIRIKSKKYISQRDISLRKEKFLYDYNQFNKRYGTKEEEDNK